MCKLLKTALLLSFSLLLFALPSHAQKLANDCKVTASFSASAEEGGNGGIDVDSVPADILRELADEGAQIASNCPNNGCPGTNNNSDDCIDNCPSNGNGCYVCCVLVNPGDLFEAGSCHNECTR